MLSAWPLHHVTRNPRGDDSGHCAPISPALSSLCCVPSSSWLRIGGHLLSAPNLGWIDGRTTGWIDELSWQFFVNRDNNVMKILKNNKVTARPKGRLQSTELHDGSSSCLSQPQCMCQEGGCSWKIPCLMFHVCILSRLFIQWRKVTNWVGKE